MERALTNSGEKNTIIIVYVNKLQETFNPLTTTLLAFKGIIFPEASFGPCKIFLSFQNPWLK